MKKLFNKLTNKTNGSQAHTFISMLARIHSNFCLLVNRAKEFREQLILDEKRLNDMDFEKEYNLTKDDYRNSNIIFEVSIRTDDLGKFVAELFGLTRKQIASRGYNYTTLGYEIAKLNIHDADFHTGEYDNESDQICFQNIDYSTKKKSSVTAISEDDFYVTSVA